MTKDYTASFTAIAIIRLIEDKKCPKHRRISSIVSILEDFNKKMSKKKDLIIQSQKTEIEKYNLVKKLLR